MMEAKLSGWETDKQALKPAAQHATEIVSRLNSFSPIRGGAGIILSQISTGGVSISSPSFERAMGILVKITTSLGKGNYGSRKYTGVPTYSTGSVSLPGDLVDPGYDNCIVVNLGEIPAGQPLAVGSWVTATPIARATNAAGAPAVLAVTGSSTGTFFVQVVKDGGSDGTSTAPASWTYTVKTLDGANTLGSRMALARPRPNGSMLVNGSTPAYGLAFYDLANPPVLHLWDAGEVPNTYVCG